MASHLSLAAVLVAAFVALPGRVAVAAPPRTVTVLYFDNDTGDAAYDVLGKGLADMMITDLSAVPGIQVVEREKLEALLKELKLQRSKFFDPSTVQRIGQGIGAEFAVTGSFISVAPDIRIDTRVIEVRTGRVVKASKVTGKQDKFFDLQQELVAALVSGLAPTLSTADTDRVRDAMSRNHAGDVGAAVTYGKGLDLRDRGDLKSASEELARLVEKNPRFALARTRYRQILDELYAAKSTRTKALADAEAKLLAHLDGKLADYYRQWGHKPSFTDSAEIWPYRILRGTFLLKKLGDNLDRPATEVQVHLRAYVDNQLRLLDEIKRYQKRWGRFYRPQVLNHCDELPCFTGGAKEAARDLGLEPPWKVNVHDVEANQVAQDLAQLLMFGDSPFYSRIRLPKRVCFYKLDRSYVDESFKLFDEAIAGLGVTRVNGRQREDLDPRWVQSEIINLHQAYAMAYLVVGKPEDAMAKLQAVLTRYPKAKEFQATEEMLKGILAGQPKMPNGKPFAPGCLAP